MRVNIQVLALPMLSEALGAKELAVDLEGETVADLIDYLVLRYGQKAKKALQDERGQLDMSIQLLLNGKEWITHDRLDTRLKEGDSIAFMLLAAGGRKEKRYG